ncbi:MAG: cyclopropane fatty acyl phospholipid synthase [Candidatus Thiodiazotropha sp.]
MRSTNFSKLYLPEHEPASRSGVADPPPLLQTLASAAGIVFNGSRPWDIQVRDTALYRRVMTQGSLGFGEAYMDGLWESARLDETMTRLIRANHDHRLGGLALLRMALTVLQHQLLNLQSRRRAFEVGKRHYDIGNDLYAAMLDSSMSYSCAYWKNADDLETAQRQKLDLICRKLQLRPGERLLDIGCGWGGLAEHAARHYGVEVVGITISEQQSKLAQTRCRGLPVEIRLQDYRQLKGRFDKLVSVGMFEHVGPKNYATFFQVASRVMDEQGLMLLHTIGTRTTSRSGDPWINRYIFPNGILPSARQITQAVEPGFVIEDWHNFGPDYDRTLMAWWQNFNAAWQSMDKSRYDRRFYRMWKYYLHACAGFFRARDGQLWQLVLSRPQRRGIYRSLR